MVLPAPDEPNSAVTPACGLRTLRQAVKSPRRFSTSTAEHVYSHVNPVVRMPARLGEPLRRDQRGQRENDRDSRKPQRGRITRGHLCQRVDRGRGQCLGFTGNGGHERDRRAELAERVGEGQHRSGEDFR